MQYSSMVLVHCPNPLVSDDCCACWLPQGCGVRNHQSLHRVSVCRCRHGTFFFVMGHDFCWKLSGDGLRQSWDGCFVLNVVIMSWFTVGRSQVRLWQTGLYFAYSMRTLICTHTSSEYFSHTFWDWFSHTSSDWFKSFTYPWNLCLTNDTTGKTLFYSNKK